MLGGLRKRQRIIRSPGSPVSTACSFVGSFFGGEGGRVQGLNREALWFAG